MVLVRRVVSSQILAVLLLLFAVMFVPAQVSAAQLTSRKVTLESSAPSATTGHNYAFTIATTNNVGSIIFEYCTTASGGCTGPTGLDVDSVTLDAQTGASGFAVDATETTTNKIVIDRTPASISASQAVTYDFGSAVNSSTANQTFFVRISTTDAADGGGSTVDTGVVAGSTAAQITLQGTIDETLTFCTGTSGVSTSSCSGATGSSVSFGTFSASATSTGTSQIGAGTNAQSGYVITINGATLTSGGNTISALATQTASSTGSEQFGLNLKDNTTPNVGAEPDGAGDAAPHANYGTADQFRFVTGDTVATDSDSDSFRRFTVSYIVNIANSSEAGIYNATMTYICTATF